MNFNKADYPKNEPWKITKDKITAINLKVNVNRGNRKSFVKTDYITCE